MKKIVPVILPSILIGVLLYLDSTMSSEGSLYILPLIYIVFPIIFILQGMFLSKSLKYMAVSLVLSSASIIVLMTLWYNIGGIILAVIAYLALSIAVTYLKNKRLKYKKVN